MTRSAELLVQPGGATGAEVRGIALLLHGGTVNGHGRPSRLAALGLNAPAKRLAELGRGAGVAVVRLRYRFRGWNGAEASTLVDTEWALEALRRDHGDVPVVLVGNSLGGRAAFRAAGHPNVVAVAGVAPWLPRASRSSNWRADASSSSTATATAATPARRTPSPTPNGPGR
ncbi:alpha/beta fold hydrolase [Streptosporangium saharense]|uniref:alpha/beta fold hydrolase n=1 Tax=Streptosporangium saharense TaxID=1706840 RepID=UPI0036BDD2D0